MRVADSNLKYEIQDIYILDSGTYFFFEDFVISEINEGINFDWELAKEVIDLAEAHYGKKKRLGYISNRINSYSYKPQDWLNFFENRNSITAFAIVSDDKKSFFNLTLEKIFFSARIKKFNELEEAIEWALQYKMALDEFDKV